MYACFYYYFISEKYDFNEIDSINESYFTEKDKGQRISAFSYLHLMNNDGTALQDNVYDLAVYKVRRIVFNFSLFCIIYCNIIFNFVLYCIL